MPLRVHQHNNVFALYIEDQEQDNDESKRKYVNYYDHDNVTIESLDSSCLATAPAEAIFSPYFMDYTDDEFCENDGKGKSASQVNG